jgi:hypothetical protein
MLMAANIALVIVVQMVCFFGGTFIAGALAGFAAAFFGAPHLLALTGLLAIPSLIGLGHFAGRWIARRQPRPGSTEIIVGCVVYTSVSAVLAGFAHPAAAAASLAVNTVASFVLYRSAQHVVPGAAVAAAEA